MSNAWHVRGWVGRVVVHQNAFARVRVRGYEVIRVQIGKSAMANGLERAMEYEEHEEKKKKHGATFELSSKSELRGQVSCNARQWLHNR
jgi:hypothetical protein